MSFPFHSKEFTFTQPDGTQITVKGWGDQHYAVFETLDGRVVLKYLSGDKPHAETKQFFKDAPNYDERLALAARYILVHETQYNKERLKK